MRFPRGVSIHIGLSERSSLFITAVKFDRCFEASLLRYVRSSVRITEIYFYGVKATASAHQVQLILGIAVSSILLSDHQVHEAALLLIRNIPGLAYPRVDAE